MSEQTIQSGWFSTPTNTPTGAPKMIAVDSPYITASDYLETPEADGLGLTSSSKIVTNGQLDKIILRASSMVNRICGCWFDTQTIDETKTGVLVRPLNPQLVSVVLQNAPYQMINSIYIQVLKWFIQIDVSPNTGYLQDFPDYGYYRIVPMLSTAGTGVGSPLPAEIVDRVPLGIIWSNYTFGYGTPQTAFQLSGAANGTNKTFQAAIGNRLWARSQTTTIYDNGVAVGSTLYSIDYVNGIVEFVTAPLSTHIITADFNTNESIPEDIRQAVIMLTSSLIFNGSQNPGGVSSLGINAYNVNYGDNAVLKNVKDMLQAYRRNRIKLI